VADFDTKDALIAKHKAKPGLRGKVDANCIDCIYDPLAPGNWRKQVTLCSVYSCPLHGVRPTSEGEIKGL